MLPHFGLDISDHSLKCVRVLPSLFGLRIASAAHVALLEGVVVDGEVKNETALTNHIRALLGACEKPITTPYVILSLPDQKTFTKLLHPPPGVTPTYEWVLAELEHHIPIPVQELTIDWKRAALTPRTNPLTWHRKNEKQKNETHNRLLVVAAETKIIHQYVSVIHKSGLIPVAFETEAEAIVRALALTPEPTGVYAIVDLGANQTKLIYREEGATLFVLTHPLGGMQLSHLIAEKLSIPIQDAEQAKMICGFDEKKCHGAVAHVLSEYVEALGQALKNANAFYQEHADGHSSLSGVVLVGGNAALYQLPQRLATLAGVSVSLGNPLALFHGRHPAAVLPKRDLLRYTTAIGLALRDMV